MSLESTHASSAATARSTTLGITSRFSSASRALCAVSHEVATGSRPVANAPFKGMTLPPGMARVQARLAGVEGGDRQMVDLLVAAHQQGVEAVEAACTEALQAGLRSADAILNILARRTAPVPTEAVTPPAHLRLREEPVADCARLMTA